MSKKKIFSRITVLLLALAMILPVTKPLAVSAAKKSSTYFAYRVDVMDAHKPGSDTVTLQVISGIDGAVYCYVKRAGAAAPSVKDIMDSGYKTLVPAKEETFARAHIYSSDKVEVGDKYDIYIVFEDAAHNTYGTYSVKNWKAAYFPAGTGTKNDPYQIWTDRHLYNMSAYTGEDNKDMYFKVMQDIDLSESIYSGRICDYASTFYGTFDGNKKTIRHVKGIFFDNIAATAVVKNVFLSDFDGANTSSGVAGILSEANKGIIENCAVFNSKISNSLATGIITGQNNEDGIIRNCAVSNCEMRVSDNTGGIVGRNFGNVENCYSSIIYTGSHLVGGIVGRHDKGTISGCLGNVVVKPEKIDDNVKAGGIVGYLAGKSAYITKCVSLYKPEDPNDTLKGGSIWPIDFHTLYTEYIDNTSDNVGALIYNIDDVALTEKEADGLNDKVAAEKLAQKKLIWVSHHGASADTIDTIKNPVQSIVDSVNAKGKNKTKIPGLKIKCTHVFENETAEYNKKFKITQKKLSAKKASTPGAVKFTNVKENASDNQATFTWSKAKKAEGYVIYRAVWERATVGGKYGEYEAYETISSANTTEYVAKYLYAGKKYYFRIRAYYTVNGQKVFGPYSPIREIAFTK